MDRYREKVKRQRDKLMMEIAGFRGLEEKKKKMEGVIDAGVQRERKRDLWEPLIQGPANAHIHEDLELPLQLQRSLLCFPLRMPSSTPNTVRSLFLSFPSPHSPPSIPPFLSRSLLFSASVHLLILCSFLPTNWRACLFYLFICFSPLFSFILFSFFVTFRRFIPLSLSLSFSHSLTHPLRQFIRCLCVVSLVLDVDRCAV